MKTLTLCPPVTVQLTPHQLRQLADTLGTLDTVSVTLSARQERGLYSYSHWQADD